MHGSMRAIRAAGLSAAFMALMMSAVGSAMAAPAPDSDAQLVATVKAAANQSAATGVSLVRFDGGYYDAQTRQAYIDSGMRVLVLVGGSLMPAPSVKKTTGMSPLVTYPGSCNPNAQYSHCERVVDRAGCRPAEVWLNYDPPTDHFSDHFGWVDAGQQVNVRDAPYRTYGPRAVRVYFNAHWDFMSDTCLTG